VLGNCRQSWHVLGLCKQLHRLVSSYVAVIEQMQTTLSLTRIACVESENSKAQPMQQR
jgi:hypothetical protein